MKDRNRRQTVKREVAPRKAYRKPVLRSDDAFERRALGSGDCGLNPDEDEDCGFLG